MAVSAAPFERNEKLEQTRLRRRCVQTILTINTNTTLANVTCSSSTPGFEVYCSNGTQPTPSDSGANFGTLATATAPMQIGLLVPSLDATLFEFGRATLISAGTSAATAPGGGAIAAAGTASSGLTPSKNVAAVLTVPALDGDAQTTSVTLFVELFFRS